MLFSPMFWRGQTAPATPRAFAPAPGLERASQRLRPSPRSPRPPGRPPPPAPGHRASSCRPPGRGALLYARQTRRKRCRQPPRVKRRVSGRRIRHAHEKRPEKRARRAAVNAHDRPADGAQQVRHRRRPVLRDGLLDAVHGADHRGAVIAVAAVRIQVRKQFLAGAHLPGRRAHHRHPSLAGHHRSVVPEPISQPAPACCRGRPTGPAARRPSSRQTSGSRPSPAP